MTGQKERDFFLEKKTKVTKAAKSEPSKVMYILFFIKYILSVLIVDRVLDGPKLSQLFVPLFFFTHRQGDMRRRFRLPH